MSALQSHHAEPGRAGVVLVAAGSGQRLGRGLPKARVLCGGRTLLEHALDAVIASGVASVVVVVLPADDVLLSAIVEQAKDLHGARTPAVRIMSAAGGVTRTASVRAGLGAMPASVRVVLVHDAARALTPTAVFQRVAAAVQEGATAVVPVVPVVDTVKVVDGTIVVSTPDRSTLRAVQTPQGFDADHLRMAHAGAGALDPTVTDDATLMESRGAVVHVVEGDSLAFKITTPLDLVIAEAVLAARPADDLPIATP